MRSAPLTLMTLTLALATGCADGDDGGGMVLVDPPDDEKYGTGLPFEVDRAELVSGADPTLYVARLCRGDQGMGSAFWSLDTCFYTTVATVGWDASEPAGFVYGSEHFVITDATAGTEVDHDHGRYEGLPPETPITVTAADGEWATSFTFTFVDGPAVVDVVAE